MLREVVVKYLRKKKTKQPNNNKTTTTKNKPILTSMLAEVSPSELLPGENAV